MTRLAYDKELLGQFLLDLQRFRDELISNDAQLLSRWNSLEQTWKDKQLAKIYPFLSKFLASNQRALTEFDQYLVFFSRDSENNSFKYAKEMLFHLAKITAGGLSGYTAGSSLGFAVSILLSGVTIASETSEIYKNINSMKK